MTELQKNAWLAFRNLVKDFLENTRIENFTEIVQQLLQSFKMLSRSESIKLNFLQSHLYDFLENLGAISAEQDERIHRGLKLMEERYQDRWDDHMMADYCSNIKRDCPQIEHAGKNYK